MAGSLTQTDRCLSDDFRRHTHSLILRGERMANVLALREESTLKHNKYLYIETYKQELICSLLLYVACPDVTGDIASVVTVKCNKRKLF